MQAIINYIASFLMFLFDLIAFIVALCTGISYERSTDAERGYSIGYLAGVLSCIFVAALFHMVISGMIFQ